MPRCEGRSTELVQVAELFDGFRDLTDAYSFGPPAYDVVSCSFIDEQGVARCGVVHLPAGVTRPSSRTSVWKRTSEGDGTWVLTVSTRRFAQWVVVEVPGFWPDDSWFHLRARVLEDHCARTPRSARTASPAGEVRALNSVKSARFSGSRE